MKSYALDRERSGSLPYVLSATPSRQHQHLDWWPIVRMAPGALVVCVVLGVFLKLIGA